VDDLADGDSGGTEADHNTWGDTMMFFVAVALILAAVSGVVWKITKETPIGVVGLLWGGYAVYEYLMVLRVLCSGECNIRVDLLGILPILLGVTVGAIGKVEARRRKRAKGEEQ
jgi:hypothetical protein